MNTKELIESEYTIENAKVCSADFVMAGNGCMSLYLGLEGCVWNFSFGGYCLGHGYIGSKSFDGSPKGMEYIMRIMDTIGVSRFSEIEGSYIRIAYRSLDDSIKIIGNIIEDKWFDSGEFFKKEN